MAGLTVLSAAGAVFTFFYLPWWVGAVPLPVTVLLAVALLVVLPRLCFRLTGSLGAAAAPVVAWLVVTVVLFLLPNALSGVPLRGANAHLWRLMLLIAVGTVTGAVTVAMLWAERLRKRLEGERSAPDARATAPTGDTES